MDREEDSLKHSPKQIMSIQMETVEMQSKETMVQLTVEMLLEAIKQLDSSDFSSVVAVVAKEMEKRSKGGKSVKANSAPKGVVPPQLKENFAWVKFVLTNAQQNGWEPFIVRTKKSDGTHEEVEMESSVEQADGTHVFKSTGKAFTHKEAMCLSAKLKGEQSDLYTEFKANFVPEDALEVEKPAVSAKVVRMTSEEKERKKQEAEDKKKEEKALAALEKQRKKDEAEAKKNADKALADAEKQRKKDEAEAKKKVPEVKKVIMVKAPASPPVAPRPLPVKVLASKPAAKDMFTCEKGSAIPWMWNGVKYIRNWRNFMWLATEDEEYGEWQGVYNFKQDMIDKSKTESEAEAMD